MTDGRFVQAYLDALDGIEGWFGTDAALLFMAYNQLIAAEGIAGDTLEIGVHHGRSALLVAALRARQRTFLAIDLFEDLQARNLSGSGSGSAPAFFRNMTAFYGDLSFMRHFVGASTDLQPNELTAEFSFCHIDGGHSPEETYHDLRLCQQVLLPGGLVALDDYFNPQWPGVGEGAIQFMFEQKDALVPLAIGFNKVLFQKPPTSFDVNARFAAAFSPIPRSTVHLWGKPVYLFETPFRAFFDTAVSTPWQLVLRPEATARALIEPRVSTLRAERGQTIELPVRLVNQSTRAFPSDGIPMGLSYHLLSPAGGILRWDNARSFLRPPLPSRAERDMALAVTAPETVGSYLLEVDLVWEDVMWLKERGNPTATVALTVV